MYTFTLAFLFALLPPQANGKTLQEDDKRVELFRACAALDVDQVTKVLRSKIDVNVKAGKIPGDLTLKSLLNPIPFLSDPWAGGLETIGSESWTPLMAVARSPKLPAPPPWYDPLNPDHQILRFTIPKSAIEERSRKVVMIVNLFISHGADVNHTDKFGTSALHCSVETDRVQVARILLKYGADANQKQAARIDGPSDITPLHRCKSAQMARMLLAYGADPLIEDSTGETPVEIFTPSKSVLLSPFSLIKTTSGWHVREKESVWVGRQFLQNRSR